jgi:hypothetical protein
MNYLLQASRRQHAGSIETIFPGPLSLLRKYAGPFALQTTFKQMELSMFYQTEVLKRPNGIEDWVSPHFIPPVYLLICNTVQQNEYAVQVSNDVGYEWENGEQEVYNFVSQVSVSLISAEF